jgi:hypothetical protein
MMAERDDEKVEDGGSRNPQGAIVLPYPRVSSVPLIMLRGVHYHPRDRVVRVTVSAIVRELK